MKKIEAIVRASKFDEVKDALSEKQINFFTFYEVKGYGHQKGENISYRGAIYDVGYIGRVKLEIILSDENLETAMEVIHDAARTGNKGDGLILVSNVEKALNIRTNLTGEDAINN